MNSRDTADRLVGDGLEIYNHSILVIPHKNNVLLLPMKICYSTIFSII